MRSFLTPFSRFFGFVPADMRDFLADLPTLTTQRLILRKARMRDAADIYAYAQDEEVHLGRGQVFLDEADEQVYVPGRWCLDGEAPDGELVCCVGGLGY